MESSTVDVHFVCNEYEHFKNKISHCDGIVVDAICGAVSASKCLYVFCVYFLC